MTIAPIILAMRPGVRLEAVRGRDLPADKPARAAARSLSEATRGYLKDPSYTLDGGVAMFTIDGPIMFSRWWCCDWMHTPMAAEIRRAADDTGARCLLLNINCPGGEVAGSDDVDRAIHYARSKKPVYAIANKQAASLGYRFAAQCSELVITPDAEVGYIGTYVYGIDSSEAFKMEGLAAFVIGDTADLKTLGLPGMPVTDELRGAELARVRQQNAVFVALVAAARNGRMTEESIRALKGDGRIGEEAVKAGLADRVVSFDEYLAEIKSKTNGGAAAATAGRPNAKTVAKTEPRMTLEELKSQHPSLVTQVEEAALARAANQPADFGSLDSAFGTSDGAFVTEALRGRMTMAQATSEFNKRQAKTITDLTKERDGLKTEVEQLKANPPKRPAASGGVAPVATHTPGAQGGAGGPETFDEAVKIVAAEKGWNLRLPLQNAQAMGEAAKRYPDLYEKHAGDQRARLAKRA